MKYRVVNITTGEKDVDIALQAFKWNGDEKLFKLRELFNDELPDLKIKPAEDVPKHADINVKELEHLIDAVGGVMQLCKASDQDNYDLQAVGSALEPLYIQLQELIL